MGITQHALIALVVSFIPTLILCLKFRGVKTTASKIIDEAARAGRMTKAVKIKERVYPVSYSTREERMRSDYWDAKVWYRYTVDGKDYTFVRRYDTRRSTYPSELTVFWKKGKPGKAYVNDFDKLGAKFTLYMFIPIIVFLIVFACLHIPSFIAEAIASGALK